MKIGNIIPYEQKKLLTNKYKLKKKDIRETKYPAEIEEPITKEMREKFRDIRRKRNA